MCVFVSMSASDFLGTNQPVSGNARCPKCGAGKIRINATSKSLLLEPDFFLSCDGCLLQGSLEKSVEDALANWRKPKDLLVTRLEQIIKKWGGEYSPLPLALKVREMGA